jgi:hypothetical protein
MKATRARLSLSGGLAVVLTATPLLHGRAGQAPFDNGWAR